MVSAFFRACWGLGLKEVRGGDMCCSDFGWLGKWVSC